jgi:predicted RNase H-like HicB family nuclease
MHSTLHHNYKIFTTEQAKETAIMMNATDEDWNYVVEVNPKNAAYAIIRIYDEDGKFVENL